MEHCAKGLWPLGKSSTVKHNAGCFNNKHTLSLHVEHPSGTYKWYTHSKKYLQEPMIVKDNVNDSQRIPLLKNNQRDF